MINDIRDSKNLKIYLGQLDEIKARLEHIASVVSHKRLELFFLALRERCIVQPG